jgi:hypothetical protein
MQPSPLPSTLHGILVSAPQLGLQSLLKAVAASSRFGSLPTILPAAQGAGAAVIGRFRNSTTVP